MVGRPGRAAVLAACLAGAPAGAGVLVVETAGDDPTPLIRLETPEGARWCLVWNHSVAGFPVTDCFANRSGRMVLEDSHQPDFAAGLGHAVDRGAVVDDGTGGYRITGIDAPVPGNTLIVRVGGPAVDHRILVDGKTISLSARAAGARVILRLERE